MHDVTKLLRAAVVVAVVAGGCDEGDEPAATKEDPAAKTGGGSKDETDKDDTGDGASADAPGSPGTNEACARAVVVAWKGAKHAGDDITRTKAEAKKRASKLRKRVAEQGEAFAEVARDASDASSSGPRGGLIGTYRRENWPDVHTALESAVFEELAVGEVSDLIEAPYGYAFVKRCPVEKVHVRHILVRYQGAERAGDDVTRSKKKARTLAEEIHEKATAPDADFAALARERSEGPSAKKGGELPPTGRGRLAPAFEKAAFGLGPGDISDVVETKFGFHVIKRMK